MTIKTRKIGKNQPPLIIAEIGINHSGSLTTAKQMVDAAARAGAEIIKHQTHVIDDEMSPAAKQVIPGNADISIYEIMKSCALSEKDEYELMQYVESKGLIFLSTPFSRAAADRLQKFGVAAFKIGSGELNHYPLIDHISSFGKPMIISTGMNDIAAIAKTVDIVRKKGVPFALLHTTNLYPTPINLVRLGAMMELHNAFPDVPFGLSDHTLNNNAALAAVALGASIIERHFTDTMERQGPDVACSMDETACAELIKSSQEIFQMRGGTKQAAPEEDVTIKFAFATLVSIKPIQKGQAFSKENLWAKRPGTGEMLAEEYFSLLGKIAACDISENVHIKKEMIEK
ncbi:MAG: N-acetylneuraminate synthase family protein [Defluviitaleaceae bacterium]|nr:N-acetylneuraminate synthase family protein [Defluviitaleaceae bacterium]